MAAPTTNSTPGHELEKADIAHYEEGDVDKDFPGKNADPYTHENLIQGAIEASEAESKLGIVGLFKIYYPAALWSMGLSVALVMEGMDIGLINNFFGLQAYIDHFGYTAADGTKYIPADWQAGINNASQGGQIIGLLINGWAQSKYGSRKTYMVGMVIMTLTIFILVFAVNLPMLLAGNIICGIPWGIFQTLTTAYAAEIVPPNMRGYLTSWVSMCWGVGGFLASIILRATLTIEGNWAWRSAYMLQWVWPVPLFVLAYFAPESPYYLVRAGKVDQVEKTLYRLARKGHYTDLMIRQQVELMKHTNEMEKAEAKSGSYAECFKGSNRRRTEIVGMAWTTQLFNGSHMSSYATLFLRIAGMAETMAFNYNMGISSTNIVATGIAIYLVGRLDRRWMYIGALALQAIWMSTLGIMGSVPVSEETTAIGIAVMLLLANFTFKIALGPIGFTIVGEMPSGRVRAQTIVLGRICYVAGGLAVNQLIPRMINPTAWNLKAKTGFFFLACDIILFTYQYFRLAETRGRTFSELDYLFQKKVPARQFKRYQIDPYELAQHNGVSHITGAQPSATATDRAEQVERVGEVGPQR